MTTGDTSVSHKKLIICKKEQKRTMTKIGKSMLSFFMSIVSFVAKERTSCLRRLVFVITRHASFFLFEKGINETMG